MSLTHQQRKALHLHFTMICDTLNDAGFDMKTILPEHVFLQWTPYSVKEKLWKTIQFHKYGTWSTTELNSEQLTEVAKELNLLLSMSLGEDVPFPSIETAMLRDLSKLN